MKTQIILLLISVLIGLASCKNDDSINKKESYLDYLKDKSIIAIHVQGDTKYIFTSRYCDTCYLAPYNSHLPTIEEWTVINDSTFKNYSPTDFSGLPISDNKGNLYIAKGNKIYKLNDSGEYEQLLSAGNYNFTSFTFDNENNIWLYGDNNGVAFWNKSEFKIYNTQNSPLPTDRIHGLAVDKSGVVWISLDFKGLLKIENDKWIVVSNSEIPGLTKYSYLRGPKAVAENSVWFEVFSSDTTSNILRVENESWIYEFPENTGYFNLNIDSKGTIWVISNHYDYSIYKYSTLKYYNNNSWFDFDVSDIDTQILTVNADDNKVYIGTINGLIEKPR
jgi:ligand-binding sensor domain-containing protein